MVMVLILEDDIVLSMEWSAALRAASFDVRAAVDVGEAEVRISDQVFDLVVVDSSIRKDGGLSSEGGITLISALRMPELRSYPAWAAEVPILAVSGAMKGYGFDPLTTALSISANRQMRKPFSPSKLVDTCRQMLATAPEGRRPG